MLAHSTANLIFMRAQTSLGQREWWLSAKLSPVGVDDGEQLHASSVQNVSTISEQKNRLREKLSNEVFGSFITLNRGLVALNASLDLRGLNVVMYREDRYEKEFTAVGEACMAIFWPTPGFKGEPLIVLGSHQQRDPNFCVRGTPLWMVLTQVNT